MLRGWALTASIKGENMKASFTFTLPEEQEEYEMMSHANDYRRALEDLDDYLRQKIKYAPDSQPEDHTVLYQEIRSKLWELRNND